MSFTSKCPECGNESLEYSMDLTLREYVGENVHDIKTILPYTETPILPEYVVMRCALETCKYAEKVTIEDYVYRVRNSIANTARAIARNQIGTPENYENYFVKYVYEKGLHKQISDSDRKQNPYLDKLVSYVEKKYS